MDWRVWQSLSRRLQEFRLLLVDLRGHGQSAKPNAGYGLIDYASDIERLMSDLDLSDATIVGSSLGALVAIAIEPEPGRISHRVLVDPPLHRSRNRRLFREILEAKRSGDGSQSPEPRIAAALRRDDSTAGRLIVDYMTETWMAAAPGVLVEALEPSEGFQEIESALGAIDEPTLIMHGDPRQGSVLTPDDARLAASTLPKGMARYYSHSGHAIHATEPLRFVADLKAFVEDRLTANTPSSEERS